MPTKYNSEEKENLCEVKVWLHYLCLYLIHYSLVYPAVGLTYFIHFNSCIVNGYFSARLLVVMELMEGGELFDRISKQKGFTERRAAQFFHQVLTYDENGSTDLF